MKISYTPGTIGFAQVKLNPVLPATGLVTKVKKLGRPVAVTVGLASGPSPPSVTDPACPSESQSLAGLV